MSEYLTKEECTLLELLRMSLSLNREFNFKISEVDWERLFCIAEKHAVLPLLYDCLQAYNIPDSLRKYLKSASMRTVQQSYRLAFLSKELIDLFDSNDIFAVVLKGACASVGYPVPELRKSGDIDLLINPECVELACKLLEDRGCIKASNQHANHHVAYFNHEGIEIELHTMLTEPLDNEEINTFLFRLVKECKNHTQIKDVMGIHLKTLEDGYFAYHLLLHMLQHFLRAGFGLKLLCDWVAFWNSSVSQKAKEDYLRLVTESKLKGFSDVVTALCVYKLGLEKSKVSFMFNRSDMPDEAIAAEFLQEILEAEEFGGSSNERMVIMRGTGIKDYAREFHHQMQLNYPNAGKHKCLWPFTWIATLVGFLINNKKIRATSTGKILKKAHSRSKLMKNIALFEK